MFDYLQKDYHLKKNEKNKVQLTVYHQSCICTG